MLVQLYAKHYISLADYPVPNDYQTHPQNPQPNPKKMLKKAQYTSISFIDEEIWLFSTVSDLSYSITFKTRNLIHIHVADPVGLV